MIESTILLCVFISSLSLIIIRSRFDLLLILFGSTTIYHWQILSGQIWVPPYSFDVGSEAKIILIIIYVSICIGIFFNDRLFYKWFSFFEINFKRKENLVFNKSKIENFFGYLFILTSFLVTITFLFQAKLDLFTYSKTELNAMYPISASFLLAFPAGISLPWAVYNKKYFLIFISSICLLTYFLIGFRSIAIVAIISALTAIYFREKIISKSNLKLGAILILIFSIFVIYKQIYIPIKNGESISGFFESTVSEDERFSSVTEYLLWSAFSAEFGQVACNLDLVSKTDLSDKHSIGSVFIGSIPLINDKDLGIHTNPRFSDTILAHANPGFNYGLGGTFWGEIYTLGSYIGVFLGAMIIMLMLIIFNHFIFYEGNMLLLYIGTNISFLIAKMDIFALIGIYKNMLILFGLGLILFLIYKSLVSNLKYNIKNLKP